MHRLDSHINDIEPRIKAIFENVPKQEEPSLQQSLSSYGWILLDSWIAWRTLRFLLRETYIDDNVNDKWFQTPSSYTASQLKAVWKFSDTTIDYLTSNTGKGFKELIDKTIQGKRNSSAHFTKRSEVSGMDFQEIKIIFQALYRVFMLYECGNFFCVVCDKLLQKGYEDFEVCYPSGEVYTVDDLLDSMSIFAKNTEFYIKCNNNEDEYIIVCQTDGCKAGFKNTDDKFVIYDVVNEEQSKYNFLGNKGFYQNVDLFIKTVEICWTQGTN